ncbi:hypothetical protein KFZ76_12915 [Methylovulum psychrotolerans]|uniref:hypothetical protein n=1 Tax=Methylovulum psychrotolerans TaxID=1704499 RepID=UPI001BFFAA52|nr:hypothetical protein [Methylovulum psychrotolerans]MBT9098602.1 hypothetical protein [Methylovulum psychrotolerans]
MYINNDRQLRHVASLLRSSSGFGMTAAEIKAEDDEQTDSLIDQLFADLEFLDVETAAPDSRKFQNRHTKKEADTLALKVSEAEQIALAIANLDDWLSEEKRPKSEQGRQKNRLKKIRSMARLARDTTLSIKCGFAPLYVSIDLASFTLAFFNTDHLPEYSRLPDHHKLLLSQYVLNDQSGEATSFPFVFRFNLEQRKLTEQELNKKIQRKLTAALNRIPLFWMTSENDGNLDKTITHKNGEILLYPDELEKCRQAFRELFGLQEIDADGTITAKAGLSHAIRFPLARRQREAAKHGRFYAVFNWVGYSTKQNQDRESERLINKRHGVTSIDKNNYCYISADLNKMASKLYAENIRNSK